jgi:hypothetical protein
MNNVSKLKYGQIHHPKHSAQQHNLNVTPKIAEEMQKLYNENSPCALVLILKQE